MHALALMLLQSQPDPEQVGRFLAVIGPLIGILILVGYAAIILPCWFICKKAGFSPWLSLLNLVPLGSLILLYVLAFAEWKPVLPPVAYPPYPYPPAPPQA